MKKLISILCVLTLICFAAIAEFSGEEAVAVGGVVLEIHEDGYLIMSDSEIKVLTGEETYYDTDGDINVGDYIYVDYNGQMTRSLPPQVSAQVIRRHVLAGEITEHLPEENAVIVMTETHGEVYAYLPEEWKEHEIDFNYVKLYFDGVMTMSLPAKVSAGHLVPGYEMQGVVTEMADEYFMLGEGMEAVQVNVGLAAVPEDMKTGDIVRIYFDGAMTMSLPAQVSAWEIIQISR